MGRSMGWAHLLEWRVGIIGILEDHLWERAPARDVGGGPSPKREDVSMLSVWWCEALEGHLRVVKGGRMRRDGTCATKGSMRA